MTPDHIEQMVNLLQKHSLKAFEFEQAGARLSLKLDAKPGFSSSAERLAVAHHQPRKTVCSPSMGVLRLAHPQREAPFVQQGSEVKQGQVIGFLQNGERLEEISATCSGVLVAVIAREGQVVGYAQPLFELR